MLLKVVGVQRMDFRFDDGKEIHGWKLHGIELDKTSDNLIGNTVQTVMIRDDSPIADTVQAVSIGDEYKLFFGKGSNRVEFMMKNNK